MDGAKLVKLDQEARRDHTYIREDDECFYLIEYTKGMKFDYSAANGFIGNLKKSPLRRGSYEWKHKLRAMSKAANTLQTELPAKWAAESTFVPVPPSKAKGDAEYDDRMTVILKKVGKLDVRELVNQSKSMAATHVSNERHTITALAENYVIDESQAKPTPKHIVVVDDMVTAGAHYRAMAKVLNKRFPGVPITGLFLARRIFHKQNGNE